MLQTSFQNKYRDFEILVSMSCINFRGVYFLVVLNSDLKLLLEVEKEKSPGPL